jgi:two-component system response regulator AtoC
MTAAEAGSVDQRRSPRLRILVVDDEEPIRRALLRFLHRRGHLVDVAADGSEALRLIRGGGHDVILTDLRMPGMGGELLLDTLRERDPDAARRVMFMTGHVVPGDGSIASAYADVPLIQKPFSLDELSGYIEEHAARDKAQRSG